MKKSFSGAIFYNLYYMWLINIELSSIEHHHLLQRDQYVEERGGDLTLNRTKSHI